MKQLEDQEKLWLQSGSVKQGMESSRTREKKTSEPRQNGDSPANKVWVEAR